MDQTLPGPSEMAIEALDNLERPVLAVVVDTEEEFDWSKPFSRDHRSTTTIAEQGRAHEIFADFQVKPTHLVDFPVVANNESARYVRDWHENGVAEIGAHLHPWVNPPDEEDVNSRNSYLGNLPPALEAAKLRVLGDAIEAAIGVKPDIFKAGRYGLGPNTWEILRAEGYRVDCSVIPLTSGAADGGPEFYDQSSRPFWTDISKKLLEIPATKSLTGLFRNTCRRAAPLLDNDLMRRARLVGLLARSRMLERISLTPEGITFCEQRRLVNSMLADGHTVFTLTYHSPSLGLGHTSYVQDDLDRQKFLARIRSLLAYFRDEVGGRFVTLGEIRDMVQTDKSAHPQS